MSPHKPGESSPQWLTFGQEPAVIVQVVVRLVLQRCRVELLITDIDLSVSSVLCFSVFYLEFCQVS
jgi:hypothetical protein